MKLDVFISDRYCEKGEDCDRMEMRRLMRIQGGSRKIACSGFSIEASVRDLIAVYYYVLEGC